MLRRIPEFIAGPARLAILALALTLYPLDQALADHDLREAWTRYQESCNLLEMIKARKNVLEVKHNENMGLYIQQNCREPNALDENVACQRLLEEIMGQRDEFKSLMESEKVIEKDCSTDAVIYRGALAETLTELVVTGSLPDPSVLLPQGGKPPKGSSSSTNRRRRKPPSGTKRPTRRTQRGHTKAQSDAAAIITGIIIQGVGQAISRGNRRSGGGGGSRGAPIP
jgi:hypothetical protein